MALGHNRCPHYRVGFQAAPGLARGTVLRGPGIGDEKRRGPQPSVSAETIYEHTLVRPGDLRRLDAAFFTMNGVISIVFLGFVFAERLLR